MGITLEKSDEGAVISPGKILESCPGNFQTGT